VTPREGRVSSLLGTLAGITGLLAAGAAIAMIVGRLVPPPPPALRFPWHAVVLAGAFFFSNGVVATRFLGVTWQEIGWHARAPWFFAGLLAGVALAALAVGLVVPGSRATLRPHPTTAALVPLVAALLAAALCEELIFRGAPLALLARVLGRWPATLCGAVGFGLAHLHNPHATVFSTLNIALAAVLLSVAFWSRGGMPLAWGLHFGWNTGLGLVFGAPVSGIELGAAPFSYATGVRPWVDGGAFGPEGGAAATLAFIAGVALLVGRRFPRPATWLA
jgi:uncharacterized protein